MYSCALCPPANLETYPKFNSKNPNKKLSPPTKRKPGSSKPTIQFSGASHHGSQPKPPHLLGSSDEQLLCKRYTLQFQLHAQVTPGMKAARKRHFLLFFTYCLLASWGCQHGKVETKPFEEKMSFWYFYYCIHHIVMINITISLHIPTYII